MLETLSEAMTRLGRDGYVDSFRADADGLRALDAGRVYAVETLDVDEVVRFEGESNPDDEAILFALRSREDGIRGTYTLAYGPGVSPDEISMVRRLDARAERRRR